MYKARLHIELTRNQVYAPTDTDFLTQHKAKNQALGLKHVNQLPYLYATIKGHKDPIALRYIAGVSKDQNNQDRLEKARSSTTNMSKQLSGFLKAVLRTLRRKDKGFQQKHGGAKRCWIVESAEEVAYDIKTHENDLAGKSAKTYDFTTMYTNLTHETTRNNVQTAIHEAWQYQQQQQNLQDGETLQLQADDAGVYVWTRETEGGYSEEEVVDLLTFLLGNFAMEIGDQTVHQQSGLPMGTNAAPDIANLCCYATEAAYIDELVAAGKSVDFAKHVYRFIDDSLFFDGQPPPAEAYGMQYKETTYQPNKEAHFLGMRIEATTRGQKLSVIEKQDVWSFQPIKYPHASSNIPKHQGSGVLKGLLTRAAAICNNMQAFRKAITQYTTRLTQRGHDPKVLARAFRQYMVNPPPK